MSDFNWHDYPTTDHPSESAENEFKWDDHPVVDQSHGKMSQFVDDAMQSLPTSMGLAGGIAGAFTPIPGGSIMGAGAGGTVGTGIKNLYNHYANPSQAPQTNTAATIDPFVGGAKQALMQGVAEALPIATMGGLQTVGQMAPTALKKEVSDYLAQLAENRAAKAMGATKAAYRRQGEDSLRQVGRYGLDQGVVTPFASTESMIDKNAANQMGAMKNRQGIYDAIDQANASQFNPLDAAQALRNKVKDFNTESPLNAAATVQLQKTMDALTERGSDNISMKEAQALQEELGRAAKFDQTRPTLANDVAASAARANREYLNQSAEDAAQNLDMSGAKQTIQNANKTYSMG
ncbi:MAG TPA: hypothetical protein VIJ14_06620, partial [Rhabdochlamydiaceae bacterium]